MADVEPDQPAEVKLPANVPTFFFEELQEALPSSVAYLYREQFWFNLGYYYDGLHQHLRGQLEPYNKFTQIIVQKLTEDSVQQKLGVCIYYKPSAVSGRSGVSKI